MAAPSYVDEEEFKAAVSIPDEFTDADVTRAVHAASRAIELHTSRKFYQIEESTRRLTATSRKLIIIPDMAVIDELLSDGSALTEDTDWLAGPTSGPDQEEPFLWIDALENANFSTKTGGIQITGTFGWPDVPLQVQQATVILANKLFKRTREAPWGIVTTGTVEGLSIRIVRDDPDIDILTDGLHRAGTYHG